MASGESDVAILSDFGKLIGEAFDEGVDGVSKLYSAIEAPQKKWDYSAAKIFNSFDPEQKRVKAAQFGLERFIHYFLLNIQDSDRFKLIYSGKDGEHRNLTEISEDILMELRDWIQEYSKNGSISMTIMKDVNDN